MDRNDMAVKKHLAMMINDNVIKNISGFSPSTYDAANRFNKVETEDNECSNIVDKLLLEENPS